MALVRTNKDVDVTTLVSRDSCLDFRRNPFPPVLGLPAEIYSSTTHTNPMFTRQIVTPNWPGLLSWVNVSYVCRHWRDIALNCQTLWTYIPTTSQRWTQELLARLQKAPLKICIRLRLTLEVGGADRLTSHVLSIAEQLMNHSQRIQELHLDFVEGTEEYHYQILSKFLSSCLPCLQHLQISNFYSSEVSFPFEGSTPALHTLMLEDCYMPWNSLELSALTTLHLISAELPFHEYVMVELIMLRRMPHLVKLYIYDSLHGAYDSLPSGEFNAALMINFSSLSNMSIGAPISIINALLPCVDIPLTTRVTLECTAGGSTPDDFIRLASLLAQRINPTYDLTPAVPKFRSLTIGINPMAMLAFSTSEHGCSFPSSVLSDEDARLRVFLLDDIVFARPCATISHMCRSIPFTNIGSIHFTEVTDLLGFWRDILVSFPNVWHIKLSGRYNYMPNIASMLSFPSHDCSGDKDGCVDGDQNEIFVPALEELELYNITFPREGSGSDLDTLCEAISTRKDTQCRLAIKECGEITGHALKALNLVGWWEGTQFKVTRDFSKELIFH